MTTNQLAAYGRRGFFQNNERQGTIMSKVAVVYWSGTGNTEAMAEAVADGIREKGGEAVILTAGEFDRSMIEDYDSIAFGCPSMGDEELEESEFAPRFESCEWAAFLTGWRTTVLSLLTWHFLGSLR